MVPENGAAFPDLLPQYGVSTGNFNSIFLTFF